MLGPLALRKIKYINRESIIKFIGEPSITICRKIFGENLSDEEIQLIRKEIRTIEDKLINKSAQLYDGVKNIIFKLKDEGYTLCICTNGSNQYVSKILNFFEINQYFKMVKSGVEGLIKSQFIKQILDESSSSSAIVIGDTSIDFKAADDTRCLSIGVSYGYGGNDYESADFTAHTPSDIYNIVKKINGLYYDIAGQILKKKQKDKPLIVGINGVDTSGKTTFNKEFNDISEGKSPIFYKWG